MKRWRELVHITAIWYAADDELPDDSNLVWDDAETGERIEISVMPLWCGVNVSIMPQTLVDYLTDGDWKELLEQNADALRWIWKRFRTSPQIGSVGVVTVWECEAGTSYVPGEPDEYEADSQLVGYLDLVTFAYVEAGDA